MKTSLLVIALAASMHTTGGKLPARQIKMVDKKTNVVVCTPQTLMIALKEYGIANPEIVWAQAMLESGELTSKLFQVNHNLFGMKLPEFRKTTAIGEHWRHAKYANWIECVKDYKLWQLSRKITTHVSTAKYLQKLYLYAEDQNYIRKIKLRIPLAQNVQI